MADFLLVHGSCHGAWCWRDVIAELRARGHVGRAIDLPGNGDDHTPPAQVTLGASAQAVAAASTPETILVGHSWGGYPVSAAAEHSPERMRGIIYLCAYVPESGCSMVDMRKRAPRQPLLEAVRRSPSGDSYTIAEDRVRALFYHDCPPEAVTFAKSRLCPQATRPQTEPLFVGDRFLRVPKAYIRCREDRTIPPEYQTEMTRNWPRDRVYEMNTSHSPFFSDPKGLAELLIRIAEEF